MTYFTQSIRLFRIISIPSKCYYCRPLDHMISMECSALDFRCQCTQQKLQPICAVLSFDPQLKEQIYKRQISIKLFYLYQKLQCTDNYFFKIKFVLFLYLLLSASWKKNDVLPFWICNQSATSRSQKNPIKGKSVFKIPNPSSPIICQ